MRGFANSVFRLMINIRKEEETRSDAATKIVAETGKKAALRRLIDVESTDAVIERKLPHSLQFLVGQEVIQKPRIQFLMEDEGKV